MRSFLVTSQYLTVVQASETLPKAWEKEQFEPDDPGGLDRVAGFFAKLVFFGLAVFTANAARTNFLNFII